MSEEGGNGVEARVGTRYIKITGRDFLVIAILAGALGYMVYNVSKQHDDILTAVRQRCAPVVTPY